MSGWVEINSGFGSESLTRELKCFFRTRWPARAYSSRVGLLKIAGLVLVALWLIEVTVFTVSYRRNAGVREARRRQSVAPRAAIRGRATV